MVKIIYINRTNADVRKYDSIIVEACHNNGILPVEFSDIFKLSLSPAVNEDGSPRYLLDWF